MHLSGPSSPFYFERLFFMTKGKVCKPCMNDGFIKPLHKPCNGNGCKSCSYKGWTQKICPKCHGKSRDWR